MASKGCLDLIDILKQIYPNQRVITEYYLGEKLYLDIYLPNYDLGFEYDGEQHDTFNTFFHKTQNEFLLAKKRDMRKTELCSEQNIRLIRISHKDPLNIEFLTNKILED